jgi:hypothetical protein
LSRKKKKKKGFKKAKNLNNQPKNTLYNFPDLQEKQPNKDFEVFSKTDFRKWLVGFLLSLILILIFWFAFKYIPYLQKFLN